MKFSRKERIINALFLSSSFIENPGLMHGKMGISILFYNLFRETENPLYEEYAGELIDEIYEEISSSTPTGFENGLAGIGWGIEYLIQTGFIEADSDEVLEDFDNRIFHALIYNTPRSVGLLDGLIGLGAYFLKRIQNPTSNDGKIITLTNKQTLIHLIDELDGRTQDLTEIIEEPQTFDICWDYSMIILFLTQLHEQNVYNHKVEKILNRLAIPLADSRKWPQLYSNRLLMAFAWAKLTGIINADEKRGITRMKEIAGGNLAVTNHESIKSELQPNNASVRNGTSGIAWLYGQLYGVTAETRFYQEMEYWADQKFSFNEVDKGFAGFYFQEEAKAFGLLEGLSGICFNNKMLLQYNSLTV